MAAGFVLQLEVALGQSFPQRTVRNNDIGIHSRQDRSYILHRIIIMRRQRQTRRIHESGEQPLHRPRPPLFSRWSRDYKSFFRGTIPSVRFSFNHPFSYLILSVQIYMGKGTSNRPRCLLSIG